MDAFTEGHPGTLWTVACLLGTLVTTASAFFFPDVTPALLGATALSGLIGLVAFAVEPVCLPPRR